MTMVAPNIGLRAQVGPYGAVPTFAGYYATVPRQRGMASYRKGGGLGQHWYDGILNAAENVAGGIPIDAPYAGGGSVTTTQAVTLPDGTVVPAGTTYVDSSGNPSATRDPLAGTAPPIIPPGLLPTIPTWLWLVGGGALVLILLGYSGVGKMIPARANRGRRRGRTTGRRRGRRGRR